MKVEYRVLVGSADIKGAGISTDITFETTPASNTVLATLPFYQSFGTETAALSIHPSSIYNATVSSIILC